MVDQEEPAGVIAPPSSPSPASTPSVASVMAMLAALCLGASLFTPRFLVGIPIFGCLALCAMSFVRKERWRGGAALVGVLAIGLLVLSQTPESAVAAPVQIEYAVSGSAATVGLTLENAQGGTDQQDAFVPWKESFTGHSGQFVYMSAQNKGEDGTVTCTISVNGTVFKTSTSSGAYAIADCSGSAP